MKTPGENFGERRMIAVRRDEGEFVAAKPRKVSLAGERAQLLRELAKHVVADRMAEHVVDLLEAVEVDAQHGERFLGRASRHRCVRVRCSTKAARLGKSVRAS